MDDGGYCSSPIGDMADDWVGCSAYCEVRLTPRYGREDPFEGGSCPSSSTCIISKGKSLTYTTTFEINAGITLRSRNDIGSLSPDGTISVGDLHLVPRDDPNPLADILKSIFNAGASLSWSKSVTYSETEGKNFIMQANECGYITFVPWFIE